MRITRPRYQAAPTAADRRSIQEHPVSPFRRRPLRFVGRHLRTLLPVILVVGLLGTAVAGCGGGSTTTSPAWTTTGGGTVAVAASVPMGDMHMPTAAESDAAWSARPDYVKQLPAAGQEAYQFALARPDVLQWLPCYCGCEGMDHRSNLDCFFQRREVKGSYTYEEHASFCDICIKTANMASQMIRDGATIIQIRAAVDDAYGNGAAPGTDTPMPPTS
jgi:hypothetical protein